MEKERNIVAHAVVTRYTSACSTVLPLRAAANLRQFSSAVLALERIGDGNGGGGEMEEAVPGHAACHCGEV